MYGSAPPGLWLSQFQACPLPPHPGHLSFLIGKAANSPQWGWEAPGGSLRALLHGGGEPQIGEVTRGESPNGDHVNLIKLK